MESLRAERQAHAVHASRIYLPFLRWFYQNQRQILFAVLGEIELRPTLPDKSLY